MKKHLISLFILAASALNSTAQNEYGSFTDARDGKTYATVTIGGQLWMAENLNYNGPGSWCMNCEKYGRLYTYESAMKSCPAGWHLPSLAEWTIMTDAAGGGSVSGGNLKDTSWVHWKKPNTGATNKTGFSARPNGYRSLNGALNFERKIGFWWTATEDKFPSRAVTFRLDYNKSTVSFVESEKFVGQSVRCIAGH